MDKPPLLLQHPIHGLAIHEQAVAKPQQDPEASIAKGRMLLNPLVQTICPRRVHGGTSCPSLSQPMEARAADSEDPTATPF